ncbi:MAG TPA: ABC transporter permease, partial [Gemmatimonadaceae bacterium]|nr:ABC transporter permease [Gemmatimonadaceae bacterium]
MQRNEYLSELADDARFAVRQLIKARSFALVAICTLALGVGATSAIFSAVEAVVLRPFPFAHPHELVFAFTHWTMMSGDGDVSVGDFIEWQRRSKSFAQLSAQSHKGMTIAAEDSPDRIMGAEVTANLFTTLGVSAELGHVFGSDANDAGHDEVVVLSDGCWRRLFGADRSVVGRSISLDGHPSTIIGVMPPDFDPTDSHEDVWTPIVLTSAQRADHDNHDLMLIGRLAPGVTIAAAQQEMNGIAKTMAADYPKTNATVGVRIAPLEQTIIGDYRTKLFVLLGAVACVLLIACGNVANLLLARGSARAKELAIRAAIGAGRARILRQLLTESLVLAFTAAAAGLGLAWLGTQVLLRAAPDSIPRLSSTHIDGRVLVFALALAVVSGFVFGLVPALRAAGGDVHGPLREGGRTAIATARDRVRAALVAAEVAIALTLLVGAGLLIRSAVYLNRLSPGFEPHGVLSARVGLRPSSTGDNPALIEQTFERMLMELRARPGVASAALASQVPLGAGGSSNGLVPEGRALDIANAVDARMRIATPAYLKTMRIPVLSGRDFFESDIAGATRVMIVSATLAKALWPNQDPLGKRVACCEGLPSEPRWKTVVGVAGDVHSGGPTQEVRPEFYLPLRQAPAESWSWINRTMTVAVRAQNGDAEAMTPVVRGAVKAIDPTLPVFD